MIREEAFARRLESACDGHPLVPDLNKGRLVWVRKEFARVHNTPLAMESIRKWFSGEARPRPVKMKQLAELLGVDEGWLSLGTEADLTPRERRMRNSLVDGAVNVVAGFIQMGGGMPAFPDEGDQRAERDHIDIYAIIKGARYDIHVAVGQAGDEGVLHFTVPTNYADLFVIGLIQNGPLCCDAIELAADLVEAHGIRRGGHVEVEIRVHNGAYVAPGGEVPLITGFDKRL